MTQKIDVEQKHLQTSMHSTMLNWQQAICQHESSTDSVAVLAEISLRSPRKIFIFTIKKYIYRIKVSGEKIVLILKKTSLGTESNGESEIHWNPGYVLEQSQMYGRRNSYSLQLFSILKGYFESYLPLGRWVTLSDDAMLTIARHSFKQPF